MATVTTNLLSMDNGLFHIESQHDDITRDFDWIRIQNDHPTRTYLVEWKRNNGQKWAEIICVPGYDETFNSGGPVRNFDDIRAWHVGWSN